MPACVVLISIEHINSIRDVLAAVSGVKRYCDKQAGIMHDGRTSAAVGASLGSSMSSERCTSCSCEHSDTLCSCACDAAPATLRSSDAGAARADARWHSSAIARTAATAVSADSAVLLEAPLSSSCIVLHAQCSCSDALDACSVWLQQHICAHNPLSTLRITSSSTRPSSTRRHLQQG